MLGYIARRILEALPVLFIVTSMAFVFIRVVPGGPFDSEKSPPPEIKKRLDAYYHLDKPLHVQYLINMKNMIKGDFGYSMKFQNRRVLEMIGEGMPRTAELALYAILFAMLLGVLSGLSAALNKNTALDYAPMSLAMFGVCVPSFLLGPLLVLIFGIWFEWLPVSGWDDGLAYKILPTITLGSAYAAYVARLSRGGMLEVLSQDYIRTARAKGVPEKMVILKHAVRGGLLPVVSFLGPAMAGLLAGSFVTETIFSIPGIGRFYVEAAFNRDQTLLVGVTILFSMFFIGFNMLSDVVLVMLNPRLSFARRG